jgi:hypothetical protein
MMETERITNEVMDRHQIPTRQQVELDRQWRETGYEELGIGFDHTDILGEIPNTREMPPDCTGGALIFLVGALGIELMTVIIWGLLELRHSIMFLAHWLVSHAH